MRNVRFSARVLQVGAIESSIGFGACNDWSLWQFQPDDPTYLRWKNGDADLVFPSCRSRLHKIVPKPISSFVKQKSRPEVLYYDLCRYTHSRPDASDGSLWESNGPVYNGRAIRSTFDSM